MQNSITLFSKLQEKSKVWHWHLLKKSSMMISLYMSKISLSTFFKMHWRTIKSKQDWNWKGYRNKSASLNQQFESRIKIQQRDTKSLKKWKSRKITFKLKWKIMRNYKDLVEYILRNGNQRRLNSKNLWTHK
mgnify:CR=1 FL=1